MLRSVDRIGSVESEIRVALDPVPLQAIGLTAVSVSQQLYGSNADFAGGRLELGAAIRLSARSGKQERLPIWKQPVSGFRAAATCGWTPSLKSPRRSQSRPPSHVQTEIRSWDSAFCARRVPAMLKLRRLCRPRSIISRGLQEHVQNRSERQLGRLHPRQLSRCAREPVRGRRAGDPGGFPVPA